MIQHSALRKKTGLVSAGVGYVVRLLDINSSSSSLLNVTFQGLCSHDNLGRVI